jgi:hypothetical protein
MTAKNASARPPVQIALLLRAYLNSEKTIHLARQLESIEAADLFICADTTNGPVRIGDFRYIEYSLQRLEGFGLRVNIQGGRGNCLWFCGDYSAYPALIDLPEYDYYFMIEYDVYFSPRGLAWLQSFCEWLKAWPTNRLDCFAPNINYNAPPQWHWHSHAQQVGGFDHVSMFLFSMFVISKSAAAYLYSMRLIEAARVQDRIDSTEDSIGAVSFCEYFVPSSLLCASGFQLMQLKDLPDSLKNLSVSRYTSNRPMCLDYSSGQIDVGDMAHPVLDAAQYVKKLTTIFKNDQAPFSHSRWIVETTNDVPDTVRMMKEYDDLILAARSRLAKEV